MCAWWWCVFFGTSIECPIYCNHESTLFGGSWILPEIGFFLVVCPWQMFLPNKWMGSIREWVVACMVSVHCVCVCVCVYSTTIILTCCYLLIVVCVCVMCLSVGRLINARICKLGTPLQWILFSLPPSPPPPPPSLSLPPSLPLFLSLPLSRCSSLVHSLLENVRHCIDHVLYNTYISVCNFTILICHSIQLLP